MIARKAGYWAVESECTFEHTAVRPVDSEKCVSERIFSCRRRNQADRVVVEYPEITPSASKLDYLFDCLFITSVCPSAASLHRV